MSEHPNVERGMTTLDDRLSAIEQKLDEILDRLDRMEGFRKELISKKEAAALLGVSPRTIEDYRAHWTENLHYFPQAKGSVYNRVLLEDWQRNRFNPAAHQKAINQWAMRQEGQHRKHKK